MKIVLFFLFSLTFYLSAKISSTLRFPFAPLNQLIWDIGEEFKDKTSLQKPLGSEGGFRDLSTLLFGMRKLAADIAWISVLQYYGTSEIPEEEGHSHHFEGGNYPALKKIVLRVVRLDPSLHYAYFYGAGALGWNLNRPQEAMELLQEAIHYNPGVWKFRYYVGALIYKEKGELDNMIRLLEETIKIPDCPTMMKSILANIYKGRKNYKRALEIWIEVYENETTDAWYKIFSEQQIKDLRKKLRL